MAARVTDGVVGETHRRATPGTSGGDVIAAVCSAVAAVHEPNLPVGIAVAGQIDPGTGVILSSPNLPGRRVPLGAALEDRFSVPVAVNNDVRLAAAGEWLSLPFRPSLLVALYIGTGLGAGVVVNGKPFAGAHSLAAEAGHATFRPGGELCECGRRGCFEAYAGGRAIVRRMRALLAQRGAPATEPTTPARIAAAAVGGEPAASAVWVTSHLAEQAWSGFDPPAVHPGHPDAPLLGAARAAWETAR